MDLGGWLRSLGLERYEAAFRARCHRSQTKQSALLNDARALQISSFSLIAPGSARAFFSPWLGQDVGRGALWSAVTEFSPKPYSKNGR
jgi:hypothetical protein